MRIAIIGHIVPLPPRIAPSGMEAWGFRYTRVRHGDGTMVDHIAHLKEELHKPREEDFSIWEMVSGSGLNFRSVQCNVLTHAGDLWVRVHKEMGDELYPEIKQDYNHVDACTMWFVKQPEYYDVIVTENLFGDGATRRGAVPGG